MTRTEHLLIAEAMERFGGSFVAALGAALRRADTSNMDRIERAWPEYMREYGPGSAPYARIAEEAA